VRMCAVYRYHHSMHRTTMSRAIWVGDEIVLRLRTRCVYVCVCDYNCVFMCVCVSVVLRCKELGYRTSSNEWQRVRCNLGSHTHTHTNTHPHPHPHPHPNPHTHTHVL